MDLGKRKCGKCGEQMTALGRMSYRHFEAIRRQSQQFASFESFLTPLSDDDFRTVLPLPET